MPVNSFSWLDTKGFYYSYNIQSYQFDPFSYLVKIRIWVDRVYQLVLGKDSGLSVLLPNYIRLFDQFLGVRYFQYFRGLNCLSLPTCLNPGFCRHVPQFIKKCAIPLKVCELCSCCHATDPTDLSLCIFFQRLTNLFHPWHSNISGNKRL